MNDTLATLNRALKAHYMPWLTAELTGFGDQFRDDWALKGHRKKSFAYFRRARRHVSRRQRAAYVGLARRHARLAKALAEKIAKRPAPGPITYKLV